MTPRASSSAAINPAWIVFPSPTSSAMSARQHEPCRMAMTGSSWCGRSSIRAERADRTIDHGPWSAISAAQNRRQRRA